MRFPDFLIIGAMKAGTTTLYYDLMTNPRIYLPAENKEPHCLADDRVLSESGRREYARYFAKAQPDQRCGEASTGYSKIPYIEGVPARALSVCGPDLRLVYVVREPVSRIVSQHRHSSAPRAHAPGSMDPNFDIAFEQTPEFVAFSRYAMQVRPWIETFGRDRVMVVVFEEFVRDRRATVETVSEFLGVPPRPDLVDTSTKWNASDSKPVVVGPWKRIYKSPLYRRAVRPLIPLSIRNRMREAVLPRHDFRPDPPSPAAVARIIETIEPDADELRRIMGRTEPIWDFDAVRRKYGCEQAADRAHGAA